MERSIVDRVLANNFEDLKRYSKRLCKSELDADDLLQDAYVRVLRNAQKIQKSPVGVMRQQLRFLYLSKFREKMFSRTNRQVRLECACADDWVSEIDFNDSLEFAINLIAEKPKVRLTKEDMLSYLRREVE